MTDPRRWTVTYSRLDNTELSQQFYAEDFDDAVKKCRTAIELVDPSRVAPEILKLAQAKWDEQN